VKLGLGTVQFGLSYGVSNRQGQTSPDEAARILATAAGRGLSVIDTAALYGTSEEVLGAVLPPGHGFRVVTKTCRFDGSRIPEDGGARLEEIFRTSLARLGAPSVYGLLLHNVQDLLVPGGELLYGRLLALRDAGLVQRIGVSVYRGEEIDRVLERFPIDLVQLPVNIFDQRLIHGGQLARLKRAGVEVHARSAFLQGLLLMAPEELPPGLAPVRPHLAAYRDWLAGHGISPLAAALGFVTGLADVDTVVCGVNDHQQLEELCVAAAPLTGLDFDRFALTDERILNPALWNG
jgi:aryl-alcohol dehydrogenase-like predicted oxidoreductase